VMASQAGLASTALPCPRLLRLLQCSGAERPRWRRRSRCAPCLGRRGRPRGASRSLPANACFRLSPRGRRTRYRSCLSSCSGPACTWRSTVRARRGGRAARAAATVQADSSACPRLAAAVLEPGLFHRPASAQDDIALVTHWFTDPYAGAPAAQCAPSAAALQTGLAPRRRQRACPRAGRQSGRSRRHPVRP
jgi:hypothetical protein